MKRFQKFTEKLPTIFRKVTLHEICSKSVSSGFLLIFKFSESCPRTHRAFQKIIFTSFSKGVFPPQAGSGAVMSSLAFPSRFWDRNVISNLLKPVLGQSTSPLPRGIVYTAVFCSTPGNFMRPLLTTSEIVSCGFWDETTFPEIAFCACEYGLEASQL